MIVDDALTLEIVSQWILASSRSWLLLIWARPAIWVTAMSPFHQVWPDRLHLIGNRTVVHVWPERPKTIPRTEARMRDVAGYWLRCLCDAFWFRAGSCSNRTMTSDAENIELDDQHFSIYNYACARQGPKPTRAWLNYRQSAEKAFVDMMGWTQLGQPSRKRPQIPWCIDETRLNGNWKRARNELHAFVYCTQQDYVLQTDDCLI